MNSLSLAAKHRPHNGVNSDLNNVRQLQPATPSPKKRVVFKFQSTAKSRFLLPIKKSIHFSPPLLKNDKITTVKIVDINRDIFRRDSPYHNPNKYPKPILTNKISSRNSMCHLSRIKVQVNPLKYYSKLFSIHAIRKRNNFAPVLSYEFPSHVESCKIKCCSPLSITGICITPKNDGRISEVMRLGSP